MASNEVGFAFQADVVNAASLTHLITGHILKALSDGGVDLYAIAASVWLLKQTPVQSSLATTVHPHLTAKKGRNGFLAKALSISWGLCDVAVEMSRTKAGTNALLLIGALSTGTSYYAAAQCLYELLSTAGCEADQLPNFDVLKPMIAYLAPLVHDLGFSKVLGHVTTSASHIALRAWNHTPPGLTAMGEAPILASAIKQLSFTSGKNETAYLIVKQRGAWLATFASYILGMSVELLHDDITLWASGGMSGKVILQLGNRSSEKVVLQNSATPDTALIAVPLAPAGCAPVIVDYDLSETLELELAYYPLLGQR